MFKSSIVIPESDSHNRHADQFRAFVMDATFPCVAARSAVNRDRMEFGLYSRLGDTVAARQLCLDLAAFSEKYPSLGTDPVSFVAMFEQGVGDESSFIDGLWGHLQTMHHIDVGRYAWDRSVSDDPTSDSFSFSIAGRAFFVVGLSPKASRLARQAPFPCIAFNFHDQFEALKLTGKQGGMQRVIRARDVQLQGFINPVLAAYGDASEARQYAGNSTADDWVCPFRSTHAQPA